MWQAPSSKVRSGSASSKRRQRERYRRPLHLRRVDGQLKTVTQSDASPVATDARVLLNDLSPKGVGLFSPTKLGVAQEILLVLNEPRKMEIRGKVAWCQHHNPNSHILSANSFSWRLGIEFHFKDEAEQKAMEEFCEELFKAYLYTQTPEG
ncbi:MAG: PilZ domain-containing protein [Bdellovibrionota bacterium]